MKKQQKEKKDKVVFKIVVLPKGKDRHRRKEMKKRQP